MREKENEKSDVQRWASIKLSSTNNLSSNCHACDGQRIQCKISIGDQVTWGKKTETILSTNWTCPVRTPESKNTLRSKRCQICHCNIKDHNFNIFVWNKWICLQCTFENCMPPNTDLPIPTSGNSNELCSLLSVIQTTKPISNTKNNYQRIISFCLTNQIIFTDNSFPPTLKSLYYDENTNKQLNIQWLRPQDINTDQQNFPWALFRTPLPSDISQGILGDCWLLSALAVIAERAELVENILVTKGISDVGAYLIRICKDGCWINVIIDDLLPCDVRKKLIYSQAKGRQLWVPLIEKAFAKLYGCYENLVSGRSKEGLATLTGYPCDTIPLQRQKDCEEEFDKEVVWAQLWSSYAAGFLMGASCGGGAEANEAKYLELGLLNEHAYSVLNVYGSNGLRLVRLRNPWGRFSWNGDWCDSSSLWTPELRKKLMPHGSDEGIFWISFDDLLKYFDFIDVCKIRKGWHEQRFKGILPSSANFQHPCISITVKETTEIDISLFQKGHRGSEKSQNPLDLCVILFRCLGTSKDRSAGKTDLRLVEHSKRLIQDFVSCQTILEPGRYILLPLAFNHWHKSHNPNYAVALHSSNKISAEQITPRMHILADVMIALAMEKGEKHCISDCVSSYCLVQGWACVIIVLENLCENQWIQVQCDCEESLNVVSTRKYLKTVDSVPPLHRQVIMVLTQSEVLRSGFTTAYKLKCQSSYTPGLKDWSPGSKSINHWPPIGPDVKGLHAPRKL